MRGMRARAEKKNARGASFKKKKKRRKKHGQGVWARPLPSPMGGRTFTGHRYGKWLLTKQRATQAAHSRRAAIHSSANTNRYTRSMGKSASRFNDSRKANTLTMSDVSCWFAQGKFLLAVMGKDIICS
jgi:hypothetical protein